ncbi:sugar transferase [Aureimonas leprariae]|uniref:sugar transferase n=1 Tax=Plantimonas leprariae TaxID=2615207 RepID=UPI001FE5B6A8|nr:sugar transferase [Aureimonas leprariae]
MLKRAVDLTVAGVLIIMLLPIYVLIALAVKLTSPGPVLFRQQRYGIGKVPFDCLKFRSMTVCEKPDEFVQCVRDDVRVTKVGKILRQTSLDELPQLFNVLLGEMSLVGPRPHAIRHDDQFAAHIFGYDRRFAVKPGITGQAQIMGLRGPTTTVDVMRKRVEADFDYVRSASFVGDVKIIAKTVPAVLKAENAF